MNEQTRLILKNGLVKPVGKTYINNLVPYYGVINKDKNVSIQQLPLVKTKELILDRDSMLYPLYTYYDVYNLKMYNRFMIKYNDFIQNYVLSKREEESESLFVVLEKTDLEQLYQDDHLVVKTNNYLIKKRIRK